MSSRKFSNDFVHSLRLAILIRPASYPYGDAGRKRISLAHFTFMENWLCICRPNHGKLYEYNTKGDTGQKRKLTTKYKILLI